MTEINKVHKITQTIINLLSLSYQIKSPIVSITRGKDRGYARYSINLIQLPYWAYKKSKIFFDYYIIHEFTHFLLYRKGYYKHHNNYFKKIESYLLEQIGLTIKYRGSYAKLLMDFNGKIVYNHYKK